MKQFTSAVAGLFLLAGCATQVQQSAPVSALANFTLADLQSASDDAHAAADQTAFQCYDYLIKALPALQSQAKAGSVGAVYAFQRTRDLTAKAGNLSGLNLACAPLVIDTQTTINRLAVLGLGGKVLAPIAVAAPSLAAPLVP